VDDDPIPRPVVERGSGHVRLAGNVKVKTASHATLEQPIEADAPESSRPGLITTVSAAARTLRDAAVDDTPAEGVERQRQTSGAEKPPKRKRPTWTALLLTALASGPGWGEARRYIEDVTTKDEAAAEDVAEASAIGQLQGRLDEQSKTIETLTTKISANTASDLEARSNGALEFRHLDGQISISHQGIDKLLELQGVDEADRPKLANTPVEITQRHDAAIERWRAVREKAERAALERAVAAGDTFGG
jgi:hypothetical protein